MKYIPALDGLRALAVILVILFHAGTPFFAAGFLGVDIFFVLSGYLITGLLLKEYTQQQTIKIRPFYIRRALRLMPALMLHLIAYILIVPLLLPETSFQSHLIDAGLTALYVTDYSRAFWDRPPGLSHTWSLSVEQHFYLICPWLLLLLLRRYSVAKLPMVLLISYAFALFWRWAWLNSGQTWDEVYHRFDTRITGLLLGITLAFILQYEKEFTRFLKPFFLITITVPLIVIFLRLLLFKANDQTMLAFFTTHYRWNDRWMLTWGITFTEWGTVAIILAILNKGKMNTLFSSPPLVWLGRLSYSLYLWHYPVIMYLGVIAGYHWTVVLLIGLPMSLLFAMISYYGIEQWGQKLRRVIPPQKSRNQT